jgi:integrase
MVQPDRWIRGCDRRPSGRRPCCCSASPARRAELVALQVEDVAPVAGGLRLRIGRGKTDPEGQGAEIGLPRGRYAETCPVRAFEAWQAVATRKAGPLFRRISSAGRIGHAALHPDAVRWILLRRAGMAGITTEGFERLSTHALRVGFITEAYGKGGRDEHMLRRPPARQGLPAGHAVIRYGFFTTAATPHAAIDRPAPQYAALHFTLRPRPLD